MSAHPSIHPTKPPKTYLTPPSYVYTTDIDTKGACYARAMQQLMVGIYLAELCLLGLFAINIGSSAIAVGPVVLQIILIIATIVFHIAMKRKLAPLVSTLPLNLLEEATARRKHSSGVVRRTLSNDTTTRTDSDEVHPGYHARTNSNEVHPTYEAKQDIITDTGPHSTGLVSSTAAHFSADYRTKASEHDIANSAPRAQKRSLFQRLFKPQTQSAAELAASLDPLFREPVTPYDVRDARRAFLHPAVVAEPPVIWLARDALGVSGNEVVDLKEKLAGHGVEVTDEGAIVDSKGKVVWVGENAREAPLWERRVLY